MAEGLTELFPNDDLLTAALLRVLAGRLRTRIKIADEPRDFDSGYVSYRVTVQTVLLPKDSEAEDQTEMEGEVLISDHDESFSVSRG